MSLQMPQVPMKMGASQQNAQRPVLRTYMMRPRYSLLVIGCLLTARIASAKDVDRQERAARTACLAGDYGKGVAILSELFVATEDPVFIYNQGRCFEQNHRYEDAIARFREYLRVGRKLGKDDRVDAQKHIADCQDLLAKEVELRPRAEAPNRGDSKEGKERAAKKACLTGDPVAGVAILTDLYIDTNDPTYLFNQGRCFEQNRRYADAIARFREYLVKAKNLRPEVKADTERHVANCEAYLRESAGETPKADAPRADAPRAEAPKVVLREPAAMESTPTGVVAPSPNPTPGRPGGGLRVAGLTVAALGGVGLLTGLVVNLKVNSMSGELEAEWDPDKESTRRDYKTAGWIAYGAGAACLAGGALLYYFGWRRGESATSVVLVPTVGAGTAGTALVGVF